MARAGFVWAAVLACFPFAAAAGPLLSATLDQTFRVGALESSTLAMQVSAVNPTGSLVGNAFTFDAGSAFATTRVRATSVPPVTRATVVFGQNGSLAGTLGVETLTPAAGIIGYLRLRAKIGKTPSFTLLQLPHSVGAGVDHRIPPTPTGGSTLVVSQFGDAWHLGAVTQTGLTTNPRFTPNPLPDARATGSVSVTPSGNTRVALVSLSRIRVRGVVNFTSTTLARLTLVYAPEPAPALLLLGAGAAIAGLGLARVRPLRPRPRGRARSARRRAHTSGRSA